MFALGFLTAAVLALALLLWFVREVFHGRRKFLEQNRR